LASWPTSMRATRRLRPAGQQLLEPVMRVLVRESLS
jgi:hypothetical protein